MSDWRKSLEENFQEFYRNSPIYKSEEEARVAYLGHRLTHDLSFDIPGFVGRFTRVSTERWKEYVEEPVDPKLVKEVLDWLEGVYESWVPIEEKLEEYEKKVQLKYGNRSRPDTLFAINKQKEVI